MYTCSIILDVNDVMFFFNNLELQHPHDGFNIINFVKFADDPTRLASGIKLLQNEVTG